jgi:hypothetical protein
MPRVRTAQAATGPHSGPAIAFDAAGGYRCPCGEYEANVGRRSSPGLKRVDICMCGRVYELQMDTIRHTGQAPARYFRWSPPSALVPRPSALAPRPGVSESPESPETLPKSRRLQPRRRPGLLERVSGAADTAGYCETPSGSTRPLGRRRGRPGQGVSESPTESKRLQVALPRRGRNARGNKGFSLVLE